jgi:iron uptake system component EfeO
MNRLAPRVPFAAFALCAVAVLAAGCGSSEEDAPTGSETLAFELTDAGCVPSSTKVDAGPIVFEAENTGTTAVTEIEILEGSKILGEKENLADGLSGSFTLTLDPGKYTIYCPGGETERGTLTVTGRGAGEPASAAEKEAVARYRRYLERNTAELVQKTEPFVAAVIAGNLTAAKALYAPARIPYERIEPVAETFGDLDPRIDARANDVSPSEFGGFHRIEKALWAEGTTAGMKPVAEQLLADVKDLQRKVRNVKLEAAQIANGANELLGEVSASKITGEEERYSHIDLVDFEANVEGAEAAFEAVEPLLSESDPGLASEIEASFEDVYASLKPYRRGDGFVSYTELTQADTRKLAQEIDALAELLSQVPAQIV